MVFLFRHFLFHLTTITNPEPSITHRNRDMDVGEGMGAVHGTLYILSSGSQESICGTLELFQEHLTENRRSTDAVDMMLTSGNGRVG